MRSVAVTKLRWVRAQIVKRPRASFFAEAVIAAAEAAGAAILQVYNSEVSKWEVELKSDSSPLTKADKEANHLICNELMVRMLICRLGLLQALTDNALLVPPPLQRIAPHIPIVSEENHILPHDVRKVGEATACTPCVPCTRECAMCTACQRVVQPKRRRRPV